MTHSEFLTIFVQGMLFVIICWLAPMVYSELKWWFRLGKKDGE